MKKDIEWLTERVLTKLKSAELNVKAHEGVLADDFESRAIAYKKVLKDINQLDEPEVLSPEWISENVEYAYFDMLDGSGRLSSATAIIKPEKLQNLLVPKQEEVEEGRVRLIVGFDGGTESYYATDIGDALDFLTDYDARFTVSKEPVIPKFVAEHIENRRGESLAQAYNIPTLTKVGKWLLDKENCETFARAWLDGYTVEEEQKYVVPVAKNLYLVKSESGDLGIGNEPSEMRYEFTEQEIKDYDPRYWAFAKPVEELEE